MEEPWTILKLIQWTTRYFQSKSIEQPRADAEVLLAHVLGMDRIQLYLNYDKPLKTGELTRYRESVRRRATREPVQYITGRQEFWSLELTVTPAVLIPRPETEILVEKALEQLSRAPGGCPLALDLGTGSGAIAIALAHEHPSLRVVAIDRSPDALAVARQNAERHRVANRVHLAALDLLSAVSPARAAFDLIASNPPYVAESEFETLAPEVRGYEPASALRGGPDGLLIVRRIIGCAHRFLKPGGHLFLEIGHGQAAILAQELAGNSYYREPRFFADYSGIPRVLHLQKRN